MYLENEDLGGGGGWRKSSEVISGDHFSEVTFKGGIDKISSCLVPNPPPPLPPGDK